MRFKFLKAAVLLVTSLCFGQANVLSEKAQISVLTCGNGTESYSMFGHTAIRVNDVTQSLDVVFNYGTFDFETPNFMLKFIKGDLQYFISASRFEHFMASYQYENRSVTEQVIDLPKDKKQELYSTLTNQLYNEDRFYTYKFIDNNCTTKTNVILNSVLDEEIPLKVKSEENYRAVLYPYLQNNYFLNLGIQLIFGNRVDDAAETQFLPQQFFNSIEKSKYVLAENKLFSARENENKAPFWNSPVVFLVVLLLLFATLNKWVHVLFFAIAGLLGVFFTSIGLYSLHTEVLWNYNVLLFNPIMLYIAFLLLKDKKQSLKTPLLIYGFGLLVYFVLIFKSVVLQVAYPILLLFVALTLFYFIKSIKKA